MGPEWLKVCGACFGLVFFLYFWLVALWGMSSATSREHRLEAAGAMVPGFSGLLLAAALWSSSRAVGLGLAVAALPILVIGRAIYEVVVFRISRSSRDGTGQK